MLAVGQRSTGLSEVDVLRAFDQGAIVRTHVLRPTWHFVAPADLRWMLRLTGPRVRAIPRGRLPPEGGHRRARRLPEPRSADQRIAGGPDRTRRELTVAFGKARLPVEAAERILPHDGRGSPRPSSAADPRRGAHSTYALVDERVPPRAPVLDLATRRSRS